MKLWEMTIQETGKQISFVRNGERESVFQLFIDADLGVAHGIQGEHFFRAVAEHIDELADIIKYICGHVLRHHVKIYESFGLNVTVLHECVVDGHEAAFVMVSK